MEVVDLGNIHIEMETGNLIISCIDYDNTMEILNVNMSYTNKNH